MCISRESDKQGGQRLTFSVVFSRLFWTGSLWFSSLLTQEFLWVLFFDLNQEVSTFIFFWFVAMQVLGFVVVFFLGRSHRRIRSISRPTAVIASNRMIEKPRLFGFRLKTKKTLGWLPFSWPSKQPSPQKKEPMYHTMASERSYYYTTEFSFHLD